MSDLTHFDSTGAAHMVDVTEKTVTTRTAIARGEVLMSAETLGFVTAGTAKKGDVIGVARLAGIMAAKRTADLIPLCHPLPLSKVSLAIEPGDDRLVLTAEVRTTGRTGVEMEALTAVTVAALTVYDMLKAVDKAMTITDVHLVRKEGGASGLYQASR